MNAPSRPDAASVAATSAADDPRVASALEDYLELLRQGRASRSDFLARHPDIAEALEDCLDGLELVHAGALDFSGPDAGLPVGDLPGAIPSTTLLGDFRIVRELGRGGMGVVYEAEQVSLGRRVALKVLPVAATLDPRQLRRFRVEAQAAGLLHHPHIVPIFAVGTDAGIPYYAMQFIEGVTLAAVIGRLRGYRDGDGADPPPTTVDLGPGAVARPPRAKAEPSTAPGGEAPGGARPSFRMVARLGMQAADALEHAHGLGVLHRDIKPANLMVDDHGDLWVTDFGLARLQDDAGLTRSGDLVGTLRYMSPEQARAGGAFVDQRTDIYSLGATLYELATLRPAFDGRDRRELIRQVNWDEPIPPRKIDPGIPRDLETILLKAMAKDVEARYPTARDLADDLRRFQADKPIRARRPTPLEHVAKWTRRHRTSVVATVAALVLAITTAAALLWREQQRTAAALAELTRLRDREQFRTSRLLAMSSATTMTAMGVVSGSVPPGENKSFYRMARDLYQGIVEAFRDDTSPEIRQVVAKAHFGAGLSRMFLGEPGVIESYRDSVAVYEALASEHPDRPDYRFHLAASLKYLGQQIGATRGLAAAEPTMLRVLAIERELAAHHPENPEHRAYLAAELARWAEALLSAGRRGDAERALAESIRADPARPEAANGLAWLLASRPDLPPHDPARALPLARRAVELDAKVAAYWNTLGVACFRNGLPDDASGAFRRSIELTGGKAGYPSDWLFLAIIEADRGHDAEARRHLDRGLAREGNPPNDPDLPSFRAEAEARLAKLPPSADGGKRQLAGPDAASP